MRKTFLPKRSLFESLLSLSWGGTVVGVAILALATRLLLPNVLWTIASPLFAASDALGGVNRALFGGFGDAAFLTQSIDKLTAEAVALRNENSTLKARLEAYGALDDRPGISAGVVARPPQSAYDTLLVAAGTREGVSTGMEAFAQGGVPIGVVDTAWEHFSRITLFSAPQAQTAGWVGKQSTAVTVSGLGGGVLRASVPTTAAIIVGDNVYVPGPGARLLGRVADIETTSSSSSVVLHIVPAVNLFNVTLVTLRETGIEFSPETVTTPLRP